MTDLTLLGIAEAGRLMARGELTSTQLTEAFLKRIEAVDPKITSYITVTADLARNAARQADMEMKGGLRRGPMHGIPVALKEIYETAGIKTTGHSALKKDYALLPNPCPGCGDLEGCVEFDSTAQPLSSITPSCLKPVEEG